MKIGDVVSARNGFRGVIVGQQGDAEGRTAFRVASFAALPQGRTFAESDLTIEPDPPLLEVGASAKLFGHDGIIDGYDDEDGSYSFTALLVLPGSGEIGHVTALHHYPRVVRSDFERWAI